MLPAGALSETENLQFSASLSVSEAVEWETRGRLSFESRLKALWGCPKYYDDEIWPKGWGRVAKGIPTMLFLQLKDGEYLTIGNDIVIQVFTNSAIRVSVQAPKDMTILRGEVLERNGEGRPKGLLGSKTEKVKGSPISVSSG